jgi:hypothetical protein
MASEALSVPGDSPQVPPSPLVCVCAPTPPSYASQVPAIPHRGLLSLRFRPLCVCMSLPIYLLASLHSSRLFSSSISRFISTSYVRS